MRSLRHWESNESGPFEIYVRPFPSGSGKWQVSTAGGTSPQWRADGRELYYVAPDGRLMAVAISTPDPQTLEPGTPVPLFQTRLATGAGVVPGMSQYVVAPDGTFLMNVAVGDPSASPITVVVNWQAALKKE